MTDTITPKLKVPFSINGKAAEVVEQDSVDELAQCVAALVNTPIGFREDQPEYGMDDPAFLEGGIRPEDIESIAGEWEPRAELITSSEMDELVNLVEITVATEDLTNG